MRQRSSKAGCHIEVVSATLGQVEIAMPWRLKAGQYAGFLHIGIVGALLDTACGFAAATIVESRRRSLGLWWTH